MSLENAKKFVTDVAANESMKEKVSGIQKEDFQTLAKVAKSNGYDVTVEELESVVRSLSEKLEEADLDSVAGGATPITDKDGVEYDFGFDVLCENVNKAVKKGFCWAIWW